MQFTSEHSDLIKHSHDEQEVANRDNEACVSEIQEVAIV